MTHDMAHMNFQLGGADGDEAPMTDSTGASIEISGGKIAEGVSAAYRWFMGMAFAIAVVAFVLVMILWFQVKDNKKKLKQVLCLGGSKQSLDGIRAGAGLSTVASYGVVSTALALLTGFASTPMLFNAATPTPPTTVTQNAQTGSSSVVIAAHDGRVDTLSVQLNAVPSAGTLAYGVLVNGVAIASMAGSIALGATSPFLILHPTSLKVASFKKGDVITVVHSATAGVTVPAGPLVETAQLMVQYLPKCLPPYTTYSKC